MYTLGLAKKHFVYMALMLLITAVNGYALNTNPDVVEPGDTISFSIPVANHADAFISLENVHIIISAPLWLKQRDTSITGPVILLPGEGEEFRLDFEVDGSFSVTEQQAELIAEVKTDTPDLNAPKFVWHFRTLNAFKTYTAECLDETGGSYGGAVAPDIYPPSTNIGFEGGYYKDVEGNIFISTRTGINLDGIDMYIDGAYVSETIFTGYVIDSTPIDISQLLPFTSSFTIAAEGGHSIVYASSDNANNVEPLKTLNLFVDDTAPGSPGNPTVDETVWKNIKEYTIKWTNPPDVSGIAGARVKFNGLPPAFNEEGIFFLGQDSVVYPAPDIVNGQNAVWLWLQDNVGNADPATAVPLSLRYDDIPPASTASAPAASGENTVTVTFASSDEGAAGVNPTGSGVSKTVLWSGYPSVWCRWIAPGPYYERYYCAHDGPVQWSSSTYVLAGADGTFAFATDKEGNWSFYTQAYDAAGNAEPVPVSTTPAKGRTFVDATTPVISKVKASAFSPDTAVIEWMTDDETTAVIDYGRTTSLGSQFAETTSSRTHSVTLTGLPNPADIYYKITAINRTGLKTRSKTGKFKTRDK